MGCHVPGLRWGERGYEGLARSNEAEYIDVGYMQFVAVGGALMSDLFRFMLIRAPRELEADDVDVIAEVDSGETSELDLKLSKVALALSDDLVAHGGPAKAFIDPNPDVTLEGLRTDLVAVGKAIARLKLQQKSIPGYSGDALLDLRRRFDLLVRAKDADTRNAHVSPRTAVLAQNLFPGAVESSQHVARALALFPGATDGSEDDHQEESTASFEAAARAEADAADLINDLEFALEILAGLGPEGIELETIERAIEGDVLVSSLDSPSGESEYFLLKQYVVDALPAAVATDIDAVRFGVSGRVPLTRLFETILEHHRKANASLSLPMRQPSGKGETDDSPAGDFFTRPSPVGVGDLLIVREHLKNYEAAEVAHIENVLKSETRERRTRRLERTEELSLTEAERIDETERDTQTTNRFALNRETNDTVREDSSLQAGVNVTASYGTTVTVASNLNAQSTKSSESSTRVATEYSRDVVDRSVQRLSERTRALRSTLRIQEFEDRNLHSFDNAGAGTKNISGVYQWVNRVTEAQVINYGRRIMFDFLLPDPALFYIYANTAAAASVGRLTDPGAFNLQPSDITEWNYLQHGQRYGATNLDPPPPLTVSLSKAITETREDGSGGSLAKAETVTIPPGYVALSVNWTRALTQSVTFPVAPNTLYSGIAVAGRFYRLLSTGGGTIVGFAQAQGDVPVVVAAAGVASIAVSVAVNTLRTPAGRAAWQAKVHAAIYQAYLTQRAEYDRAVAERITSAVQIRGRNPLRNDDLIRTELRRAALSALVTQNLPGGPAPVTPPAGYPEISPAKFAPYAPVVQFMERSFEWEQMIFEFIPYYWGAKPGWKDRVLLDDTDDLFAQFLRAGAVRVSFPVRRNFEPAVLHFIETGQLWTLGDPPPVVSERFAPMLEEIRQAAEFPDDGVAVGEPWDVRTPTTLVKLRKDDELPKWVKDPTTHVWAEDRKDEPVVDDGPSQ